MKTVFFLKKKKILAYELQLGSLRDYSRSVEALRRNQQLATIILANAAMLHQGISNPELLEVYQQADLLIPRGKTLLKTLRWLKGADGVEVDTLDLVKNILEEVEGKKVFWVSHQSPTFETSFEGEWSWVKPEEFRGAQAGDLILIDLPVVEQAQWLKKNGTGSAGCYVGLGMDRTQGEISSLKFMQKVLSY